MTDIDAGLTRVTGDGSDDLPVEPARAGRVDAIQGEIKHVYDGIEEADNALPRWWLSTYYGAIVFGVLYWFAYHQFEVAQLPGEAYAEALQAQSAGGPATEDLLLALAADPGAVGEGAAMYSEHCSVCHGAQGEGNIGPNLTDGYWLHGYAPMAISPPTLARIRPAVVLLCFCGLYSHHASEDH